jgi:hypothetical protein
VHLVAAPVVRLIGTLAHDWFSDARSVSSDLSTPGAVGGEPFGRHRPPTESRRMAWLWTCGTGRHRVTAQRYASAGDRVKLSRRAVRECLWMTACSTGVRLVRFAAERIDLGPLPSSRGLLASWVTSSSKARLTCGNVFLTEQGPVAEPAGDHHYRLGTQIVDKHVEQTPGTFLGEGCRG